MIRSDDNSMKNMNKSLEMAFIEECSPTLAGLKTGNLFNYRFANRSEFKDELAQVNGELNGKGVYVTPLKVGEGSALLYVFRPESLERDMKDSGARKLLETYGYRDFSVSGCIGHLKRRINLSRCFPHEIGLFLSYPVGDVAQFISQKGCNYKCCGIWKVYCDEAQSRKMFARYRKCSEVYKRVFNQGRSIMQLTVSASAS